MYETSHRVVRLVSIAGNFSIRKTPSRSHYMLWTRAECDRCLCRESSGFH